jgi:hypothetical protein
LNIAKADDGELRVRQSIAELSDKNSRVPPDFIEGVLHTLSAIDEQHHIRGLQDLGCGDDRVEGEIIAWVDNIPLIVREDARVVGEGWTDKSKAQGVQDGEAHIGQRESLELRVTEKRRTRGGIRPH